MRASFYECDITPPLGGYMPGHGKKVIAEDVFDRLYAKAAVIEQAGEIAALVCVDTCHLPAGMHDIVTKRIYEYTEIAPNRVCVCCNHAHKGAPVIDSPEINCFGDAAYKDVFFRLTADAVILAYKRLGEQESVVKFGKSQLTDISFNRTGILADGTYVTHVRGRSDLVRPLGEIDPDVSVLTFEKEGVPIGAVINFACHQDCNSGCLGYSGDYSSVLSDELKEKYGKDFVSLFVVGTCGDINHVNHDINVEMPKGPHGWYRTMGQKLAAAVQTAMTVSEITEGAVAVIKEEIQIPKRQADPDYVRGKLQKVEGFVRARRLLFYQAVNEEEYAVVPVQGIKIGNVGIFALPGEIFVKFGLEIKEKSPFAQNIVMEQCNNSCGYVPTMEAFAECSNIYEISLCFNSCLIPEAGEMITQKALEIGNRLNG